MTHTVLLPSRPNTRTRCEIFAPVLILSSPFISNLGMASDAFSSMKTTQTAIMSLSEAVLLKVAMDILRDHVLMNLYQWKFKHEQMFSERCQAQADTDDPSVKTLQNRLSVNLISDTYLAFENHSQEFDTHPRASPMQFLFTTEIFKIRHLALHKRNYWTSKWCIEELAEDVSEILSILTNYTPGWCHEPRSSTKSGQSFRGIAKLDKNKRDHWNSDRTRIAQKKILQIKHSTAQTI